ncbi:MAG TPA: minor capsid protein [Candidatus Enterococcus stercoravium]|nr:minor capsid protein [Candidatus Enterococcus stercoravium]
MVGIKVSIDLSGAYKKLSPQAFDRGRYNLANEALRTMNENFVPERDGNLRTSGHVEDNGKQLVWDAVYARRHYYTNYSPNYTTKGTGPRWDLKAKNIFMSDWIEAFKEGANLK